MDNDFIPIYEYLDEYAINRLGQVYSIRNNCILKERFCSNGYKRVDLVKKGKRKTYRIHRLLGLVFVNNPDDKPLIDHIDRNKTNNNLSNLRWVTSRENNLNRSK